MDPTRGEGFFFALPALLARFTIVTSAASSGPCELSPPGPLDSIGSPDSAESNLVCLLRVSFLRLAVLPDWCFPDPAWGRSLPHSLPSLLSPHRIFG